MDRIAETAAPPKRLRIGRSYDRMPLSDQINERLIKQTIASRLQVLYRVLLQH